MIGSVITVIGRPSPSAVPICSIEGCPPHERMSELPASAPVTSSRPAAGVSAITDS